MRIIVILTAGVLALVAFAAYRHEDEEPHEHPEVIVAQPANRTEREQRGRKVQLGGTTMDGGSFAGADLTVRRGNE